MEIGFLQIGLALLGGIGLWTISFRTNTVNSTKLLKRKGESWWFI
jgi:hypothetical protein